MFITGHFFGYYSSIKRILLPIHTHNVALNIFLCHMIVSKRAIVLIHCICWLVFISLPVFFVAGQEGKSFSLLARPLGWLSFLIYVFIFYLHTYFLLPKLYFQKRYILYALSLLLLASGVFFLRPFDRLMAFGKGNRDANSAKINSQKIKTDSCISDPQRNSASLASTSPVGIRKKMGRPKFDIVSFVLFIVILAISSTIVVSKRWRIAVERASRAEADKVNAELSLLKAQINPHFLFNTLNNIYSLAVTKNEHTAESIMKLSNIMRYITDDAKESLVSLQSEADFITDYIELQRLRLGANVKLDFNLSGDLAGKMIAPMILITFIENVFKYGTSNSAPSEILIELKVASNHIHFSCGNRILPFKQQLESTGIGIVNTQKRLEHIYPDSYQLDIKNADGFYTVHLILEF